MSQKKKMLIPSEIALIKLEAEEIPRPEQLYVKWLKSELPEPQYCLLHIK